jgi:hypothetical protein
MDFQGIDIQNITLTTALLITVYFLVRFFTPKVVEFLEKKAQEKEEALKELTAIHDKKMEVKDQALFKMIKDHEERSDKKDDALQVLTKQVLRESEQNREIYNIAINAIAEVRTEIIPLREFRQVLAEQVKTTQNQMLKTHDLITLANKLIIKE